MENNEILKDQIDFVALVEVNDANPNGDPLNGNRPRTSCDGLGEISDVCIKRKLRNRMIDMGLNVFVQSDCNRVDDFSSLSERYRAMTEPGNALSKDERYAEACKIWDDVRDFGALMAFKETASKKGDSVTLGITGAVSIRIARSVAPVEITSMQITKSVNGEPGEKKGSDTMGMKHSVNHGVYVITGSISPIQAQRNGMTEADAENIKKALATLYMGDASAARPEGSQRVINVYWFRHKGIGSAYKTHKAVNVTLKDGVTLPSSIDDYNIEVTPVEGVTLEVIEGA
ncbi:MAG: type I-C CRISPR-associated protein Cas7/Csd2 [Candidatus Cryptobacteroides sp.]|nr:type I-C CRISPR-associated protein Cas7/Csd2 [Candidatus Cryptobacteroides sp.]